jgi:hypothetical protein
VTVAFEVHEVCSDPIVHDSAVSVPFTRNVKLRAELLLTTNVTTTARLLAVMGAFGESIVTALSVAFAVESPTGAPKVVACVAVDGIPIIRASIVTLPATVPMVVMNSALFWGGAPSVTVREYDLALDCLGERPR